MPIKASEWKHISTAPKNRFILVACKSGYVTIDWIYRVAQFTEGYHNRWDDHANNGLDQEPEYWMELPQQPVE